MGRVSLKHLKTKIGHITHKKSRTGCTVLLFDSPSVCGVHTSGGAPGTRETALLDPTCLIERVNAILLTGGSAFGLAAADGVMRYCAEHNIGYAVGEDIIPIVPAAVIYDRNVGIKTAPTSRDGYNACKKADYISPAAGEIGAAAGATVGMWSERHKPSPGGMSVVVKKFGELTIGAVMVVNAFGNVVDPATGEVVAGAIDNEGRKVPFGDSRDIRTLAGNTTIGAILIDAALTKAQAKRVAIAAQDGLAKTIHPSHTLYDGDTIFAVSTGIKKADLNSMGIWASETAAEAVLKAVRKR